MAIDTYIVSHKPLNRKLNLGDAPEFDFQLRGVNGDYPCRPLRLMVRREGGSWEEWRSSDVWQQKPAFQPNCTTWGLFGSYRGWRFTQNPADMYEGIYQFKAVFDQPNSEYNHSESAITTIIYGDPKRVLNLTINCVTATPIETGQDIHFIGRALENGSPVSGLEVNVSFSPPQYENYLYSEKVRTDSSGYFEVVVPADKNMTHSLGENDLFLANAWVPSSSTYDYTSVSAMVFIEPGNPCGDGVSPSECYYSTSGCDWEGLTFRDGNDLLECKKRDDCQLCWVKVGETKLPTRIDILEGAYQNLYVGDWPHFKFQLVDIDGGKPCRPMRLMVSKDGGAWTEWRSSDVWQQKPAFQPNCATWDLGCKCWEFDQNPDDMSEGTYRFKATFDGDDGLEPCESPKATVVVGKVDTYIIYTGSARQELYVGDSPHFRFQLMGSNGEQPCRPMRLMVSKDGGAWEEWGSGGLLNQKPAFQPICTPKKLTWDLGCKCWEFDQNPDDMSEGTYRFKATFDGDDRYAPSESTIVTVVVRRRPTYLTVLSPMSMTVVRGDNASLKFRLADERGGTLCRNVRLWHSTDGASWAELKGGLLFNRTPYFQPVCLDESGIPLPNTHDGTYSAEQPTGDLPFGMNYIKATFDGDADYVDCESDAIELFIACREGSLRGATRCRDNSTIYEEVCAQGVFVPSNETCPSLPKAVAMTLSLDFPIVYSGMAQRIRGTLVDEDGVPVSGTVSMTIDAGVRETVTVHADGEFSYEFEVSSAYDLTATVTAYYDGDDVHEMSQSSASFEVLYAGELCSEVGATRCVDGVLVECAYPPGTPVAVWASTGRSCGCKDGNTKCVDGAVWECQDGEFVKTSRSCSGNDDMIKIGAAVGVALVVGLALLR